MGEGLSKEEEMYMDEDDDNDNSDDDCVDLFNLLPPDCISTIISSTTPRDACRFAVVSKMFKSAANSDEVWSRFLPLDLADVIARSEIYDLFDSMSRKEMFFFLAQYPLLIDGGTKSISLDKLTGKKCCCISARDLAITWGDTPRYWQWHSVPESRFSVVAVLLSVCWLEVRGKVKASLLSPDTSYVAYFVFKMTESAYGFYSPAKVSIQIDGGETETRNVGLDDKEVQNRRQIIPRRIGMFPRILPSVTVTQATVQQRDGDGMERPRKRGDGWMEVEVGEFFMARSTEDWEVEMSVMEVNGGNWKAGLVVEGFEIRPKENA